MTILVSGGTGFLGSHLIKRFIQEGFEVIALKRSTSDTFRINDVADRATLYDADRTDIEEIFKQHRIDVVVNTATDYGRVNKTISSILETNLMFAVKLLENAVNSNVKAFINTDTLLEKDINAYSLSKDQFVQWMHFLSDKTKMVNIKIEHMYGPKDDENKFIYWIINQLKHNVDKIDLTSGIQKRDFIYIDDIVEAYVSIVNNIEEFASFEAFELGTGRAVEVREFLNIIYNQIKKRQSLSTALNFGVIAYREKENMCMQADVSKLRSLGWEPQVKLEDGIKTILEEALHDTTRTA